MYEQNFGGFGQGLIDVSGMIMVYLSGESFTDNGENVIEIANYYRQTFSFIQEDVYSDYSLNSYSLSDYLDSLSTSSQSSSSQGQ